jgi:hypothetical protein
MLKNTAIAVKLATIGILIHQVAIAHTAATNNLGLGTIAFCHFQPIQIE